MKNVLLYQLLLFATFVSYAKVDTDVNVQGFGGLINVPTANTVQYGELHWNYGNLVDNGLYPNGTSDGFYQKGNIFSLTTSPFPGVEATIRNAGGDFDGYSDLSANLKIQATFIPKEWFSLAVGIQDLGGSTNQLDGNFISVSKDFGNIRLTAGTGQSDSTFKNIPPRFEGGFYGIQYQPFEWLQLQAEHDGVNNGVAIKLKTPKDWFHNDVQLYGSFIKGNYEAGLNKDKVFAQIGVRVNLFSGVEGGLDKPNHKQTQFKKTFGWLLNSESDSQIDVQPIGFTQTTYFNDKIKALQLLKSRLDQNGFENVNVGAQDTQIFVRIENSLYNRNQIDAIGVALGIVAETLPADVSAVDFTLARYGIGVLRLKVDAEQLVNFYNGHQISPGFASLIPDSEKRSDITWLDDSESQSPYFTPRIKLYPILPNFIGTEMGQFDVNVAVRANVHMPIWQGAEVYGEYDVSLATSEDFERGGSFWKYGQRTGLKSLFLRQTWQLPLNVYVAGTVGRVKERYREEHNLAGLEASWQSLSGRHRFSYHYAYLQSRIAGATDRYIYTGQYRHYMKELDTSFFVEAGQFWKGDRGYVFGASTYLGDTVLSAYMSSTNIKTMGVGITVPLGTRRNMSTRHGIQVRPAERWNYSLETSVIDGARSNPIYVNQAYRPAYLQQLTGRYFNFDRLSLDYINNNLPRLREAYLQFGFIQ